MATFGSGEVGFLLIDGYDVLGVTTTLNDTKEAMLEETHALGDTAVRREPVGVSTGSLTQEGFYDDVTDGINDALVEMQGVSRIVTYNFEGNYAGANFVGWTGAVQVNYQRQGTRAELHKANASYLVNGQIDDGKVLKLNAQELADGNSDQSDVLIAWQVDDTPSGTAFVDETTDFNSAAASDCDPFPASESIGDYFALGMKQPFHTVDFITIGTLGVGGTLIWEYWNGTAWADLSDTDNTASLTSAGTITWAIPAAWRTRQIGTDSTPYYYIRGRITVVYSTNPVISQGQINTSVDNGASSADGGIGYAAGTLTDLGGGTSLDIDIIDSTDDVTFGTLISFTGVTGTGVFARRATVAGTVERYVSSDWAIAGGGAGDDHTFMTGFTRS